MKTVLSFTRYLFALALAFASLTAYAAETDWTIVNSGIRAEWNDISCPEPRTCFAVAGLYLSGGTGALVKTSDGGASFSRLDIPTINPLHAISCPTAQVCYSAGDFGSFLKTEDGGTSWTEILLGSKANRPHLIALFALDEEQVFVVGRDGIAFRTRDGGVHWTTVSLRTFADLTAVYFSDKMTGIITGNDGVLLKTADGGNTWTALPGLRDTGTTVALRGVSNGQMFFAVGDSIRKSTDGGTTWTRINKELERPFADIAPVSEKTVYALSGIGAIFKSADGGVSWIQEFSAPSAILRGIACPTEDYCIAVGSSGTILRRGTAPPLPPPPPPEPAPALATTSPEIAPAVPAPTETIIPTAAVTETAVISESPPPPPAPTAASPEENRAAKSIAQTAVSIFTRSLKRGFRGDDVRKLQEILAGVGGVYPEGTVSGFFGSLTEKAVGRFQEKYDIAKPGEPGYGEAGPKTRAKLIEAAPLQTATPSAERAKEPSAKAVVITRALKRGVWSEEVKKLQRFLASDAELYPEGEVTGYFGSATERAVGRFQERHGIAEPGEQGYGQVGPKTRAKIKEVSQER